MPDTKIQLTGGIFQDSTGAVLNLGYLIFELSQDEQVNGTTELCSGIRIKILLNSSGSISTSPAQYLWPNDVMTPINSFYRVYGYTAQGQLAWGPNNQQVLKTPSPFNVGAWVPNLLTNWTPMPQIITLQTNGTNNGSQILENLKNGTNIAIADDGNGGITIGVTGIVNPYDIGIPLIGKPTTGETIRYTFPRTVNFLANFAGSYAKVATPAAAQTVFTIKKNSVAVCTITFAIAGATAVFLSSAITFNADDLMELVCPVQDATWSDGNFTLVGTR